MNEERSLPHEYKSGPFLKGGGRRVVLGLLWFLFLVKPSSPLPPRPSDGESSVGIFNTEGRRTPVLLLESNF